MGGKAFPPRPPSKTTCIERALRSASEIPSVVGPALFDCQDRSVMQAALAGLHTPGDFIHA